MDRELVVRAQQGDQHAFEALTVAAHPRLFRVAHGILRDPTAAEDATQQAFIDIWRHLRRLRDPARFEAWAYRIVVNACRDEVKRRPDWVSDEVTPEVPAFGSDPYGVVADRDQLSRGFARLSVDHRAVIVLRYLLDLPVEDAAEALGVPPGTIQSRLSRALASLRAVLEADARPNPTSTLGEEGAP
jgi:RNA polymerase sigma-70 factor (ECF subfamily)